MYHHNMLLFMTILLLPFIIHPKKINLLMRLPMPPMETELSAKYVESM